MIILLRSVFISYTKTVSTYEKKILCLYPLNLISECPEIFVKLNVYTSFFSIDDIFVCNYFNLFKAILI